MGLVYICLGLLLRDLTSRKGLGEVEGWSFTVANTAWLIGPLLGGFLAAKYNTSILFIIAAIFVLSAYLLILKNQIHLKEPKKLKHHKVLRNIKVYFKKRNLKLLYLLSMGIIFWWVIIYTFLPLFLQNKNMSTNDIGLVLGLVVIPLIFLEMPAGRLADKFGYKKLLFLGFIVLGLCSLLVYFLNIKYSIVLIILASFGAAFIEPLREAFFFKSIKDEEEPTLYPIFRTGIGVGRIIGLALFSTLLVYFKFESLFVVNAIIMFIIGFSMLLLKEK